MVKTNLEANSKQDFLKRLREEAKVFYNFSIIIEKAEKDGYLSSIFDNLFNVFKQEISYAIKELQKMKKENNKLDIKQLVDTNIYIFKENLKIILNSSGLIISRLDLDFDHVKRQS